MDVPGIVLRRAHLHRRHRRHDRLVAPAADQCTTDNGVTDYDDGVFTGQYQYWSGCGSSSADYVALVANPTDSSYTAVIAVQILSDADWEALDQAFNTFNVVIE